MSNLTKRQLEEEYADTLMIAVLLFESRQDLVEYVVALEDQLNGATVDRVRREIDLQALTAKFIEVTRARATEFTPAEAA